MKKKYTLILLVVLIGISIFIIDLILTKNSSQSSSQKVHEHTNESHLSDNLSKNKDIDILIFKQEQRFECWLSNDTNRILHHQSNLTLFNNETGTRLYDNETYLPEGIYTFLDSTNFLTLDFPNQLDRSKAKADQRPSFQSTIQLSRSVHPNFITFASYDLNFIKKLLVEHPKSNIRVLIFPNDIRQNYSISHCNRCPDWIQEVYGQLRIEVKKFQKK